MANNGCVNAFCVTREWHDQFVRQARGGATGNSVLRARRACRGRFHARRLPGSALFLERAMTRPFPLPADLNGRGLKALTRATAVFLRAHVRKIEPERAYK